MSLPAGFPTSLDALANPTATTNRDDPGFELDAVIARIQDILEALEAKVGIGASLPSTAGVLRRTAPGTTAWGQVAAGDVAGGGTANRVLATPDGSNVQMLQVAGGMIAGGGTANRVLATTDGATVAMQTLVTAMLAANAVTQIVSASGVSGSSASTNPAMVPLADMSVQLTTTGGPCLLLYSGSHFGSVVGTTWNVNFYVDNVDQGVGRDMAILGVNSHFPMSFILGFPAPPPALHTFALWHSISGGGGITAYSSWRNLTVIELKR